MALGVFPVNSFKTIYQTDYNKSNAMGYYLSRGVSKGLNLKPILFLIYINDLRNAIKSLKLLLFAYDTDAFCDNSSLNELEGIVKLELNCLVEWFRINKLFIYTKQSCYHHFDT